MNKLYPLLSCKKILTSKVAKSQIVQEPSTSKNYNATFATHPIAKIAKKSNTKENVEIARIKFSCFQCVLEDAPFADFGLKRNKDASILAAFVDKVSVMSAEHSFKKIPAEINKFGRTSLK